MPKTFMKYFLGILISFFVLQASAQSETLRVFGLLKDQTTKQILVDCMVQVYKDGVVFDSFEAGKVGKYNLQLPLGSVYDMKFSKAGYMPKVIRIDTSNIPEANRAGGFDMNIDGTLYPYLEGFNTDLWIEPVAKASYLPSEDGLSFDLAYSDKRAKEIESEFARLKELKPQKQNKKH